jgi:hypothetical protein
VRVTSQVPPPLTWQICQIIVDFFLIISTYVFNQLHGHWLLNDALHSTILMSLELKEENQVVISFESLMEKDLVIGDELVLHIRKGVCGVLDSFLSF